MPLGLASPPSVVISAPNLDVALNVFKKHYYLRQGRAGFALPQSVEVDPKRDLG